MLLNVIFGSAEKVAETAVITASLFYADRAMFQAKQAGRNRVVQFGAAAAT